jgi:hypothetical protein
VTRPIRTSEPASDEFREAVRWYEARRSGLGGEFLDAVAAIISLNRNQPRNRRDDLDRRPNPTCAGVQLSVPRGTASCTRESAELRPGSGSPSPRRLNDENSRRKVQNVRGNSSGIIPPHLWPTLITVSGSPPSSDSHMIASSAVKLRFRVMRSRSRPWRHPHLVACFQHE